MTIFKIKVHSVPIISLLVLILGLIIAFTGMEISWSDYKKIGKFMIYIGYLIASGGAIVMLVCKK